MAEYRCPKHDRVFEASSDQRKPGADGHPVNGHPECPKCIEEAGGSGAVKTAQTGGRRIG